MSLNISVKIIRGRLFSKSGILKSWNIQRDKGIRMKKTIKIYSRLLVICLVISLLIVAVDTNILEKTRATDIPENAGKNNEASVSPKSGLEPENPEFIKYRTNKILSKQ